eukprot:gnl/TRDRNA2_/TRDRNA2_169972_c18_seq32.p1 gnl/TRDRNA2_/TRDRNA2_169972_c18~~gnl/TRDRNA2_/TRDRNA2_169972_c18_seq32.p1  ORF type:complete len:727 (-),score=143.07 gnl/TRDRNA2_/TRDRNA2_169972_c18_seq32:192-2372(-)
MECPVCRTYTGCRTCGLVVFVEADCPICWEEKKPAVALPCGHTVCKEDFEYLGGILQESWRGTALSTWKRFRKFVYFALALLLAAVLFWCWLHLKVQVTERDGRSVAKLQNEVEGATIEEMKTANTWWERAILKTASVCNTAAELTIVVVQQFVAWSNLSTCFDRGAVHTSCSQDVYAVNEPAQCKMQAQVPQWTYCEQWCQQTGPKLAPFLDWSLPERNVLCEGWYDYRSSFCWSADVQQWFQCIPDTLPTTELLCDGRRCNGHFQNQTVEMRLQGKVGVALEFVNMTVACQHAESPCIRFVAVSGVMGTTVISGLFLGLLMMFFSCRNVRRTLARIRRLFARLRPMLVRSFTRFTGRLQQHLHRGREDQREPLLPQQAPQAEPQAQALQAQPLPGPQAELPPPEPQSQPEELEQQQPVPPPQQQQPQIQEQSQPQNQQQSQPHQQQEPPAAAQQQDQQQQDQQQQQLQQQQLQLQQPQFPQPSQQQQQQATATYNYPMAGSQPMPKQSSFRGNNKAPKQAATSWEEFTTLEGKAYYYNKDTKETTWTKPVELRGVQATQPNGVAAVQTVSSAACKLGNLASLGSLQPEEIIARFKAFGFSNATTDLDDQAEDATFGCWVGAPGRQPRSTYTKIVPRWVSRAGEGRIEIAGHARRQVLLVDSKTGQATIYRNGQEQHIDGRHICVEDHSSEVDVSLVPPSSSLIEASLAGVGMTAGTMTMMVDTA